VPESPALFVASVRINLGREQLTMIFERQLICFPGLLKLIFEWWSFARMYLLFPTHNHFGK
jgi:hypothetical protein